MHGRRSVFVNRVNQVINVARLSLLVLGMMCPSSALGEPPSRSNVPTAPEDLVFKKDISYRDGNQRWLLNVIYSRTPPQQPPSQCPRR